MVRHIDTWSEYYILSFITVYKEMGLSVNVALAYQNFMVEIIQINTSFILKKERSILLTVSDLWRYFKSKLFTLWKLCRTHSMCENTNTGITWLNHIMSVLTNSL